MRTSVGFVVSILVAVGIISTVSSQGDGNSIFERNRRQAGCSSCILLQDCPAMLKLLVTRRRQDRLLVQDAICGFDGARSKVCCPSPDDNPARDRGQNLLPRNCGFSGEFNRIFGGRNSSMGAHPWVAALGYTRAGSTELQFHCAGSLISSRYILTAAHCLDPGTLRGRRLVEIRLGEWDLLQENDCARTNDREVCAPPYLRVEMETAIIHPDYSRRYQFSDDVALIRLTENLDLNTLDPNIHPVCLPPSVPTGLTTVGERVVAVGWGMTEEGSLSDVLQQVELPIVDPARCKEVYGTAFGDKQICAGGMPGRDTCSGDSGGPLVNARGPPYQQIGIVSFGLAVCGTNNTPAVYTNVKEYKPWILENLRP